MRIRKAFLLGAGLGTRLRPLTEVVPKPLIPVFHRPLVTWTLDHCIAAGITEFAINTHHLAEKWEEAFPDGTYRGIPLHFFHEPELLETGGGIKNIEGWTGGEPILVYNADILSNLPVADLIGAHQNSPGVATLALRRHGPALQIALEGDRIVDIRRLLQTAEGTHQFTGIYCIEPALLELIPPHEKISVIPAFLELAGRRELCGHTIDTGYWLDLGTRDTYLAAHAPEGILGNLDNPIHPEATVAPDAAVPGSVIGPGCTVGPGATVANSVLWPETSVAPGAQLTNCVVYSSTAAAGHRIREDI